MTGDFIAACSSANFRYDMCSFSNFLTAGNDAFDRSNSDSSISFMINGGRMM